MKTNNKVKLSACDWHEIANALYSKINEIENGDLGGEEHSKLSTSPTGCYPDCEACANEKWVRHLNSIVKMVGEDGERAAKNGVPTSKGYKNPVCEHEEVV